MSTREVKSYGGIRHVARFVAVHDRTVRRRRHRHLAAIRVVPQQHALVIERLGRFFAVLQPGLNFVIPFVDRVAYRHDLREIPFDVPSQICITKDNTQLQVDGILYFQVTDPQARVVRLEQLPGGDHAARADDAAQRDRPDGARPHVRGARPHQRPRRRGARPGRGELGREGAALRDQGPDAAEGDPARDAGADHRGAREARGDRDLRGQAAGADQSRQRRARRGDRQIRRREAGRDQPGAGACPALLAIAEANAKAIRQVAEAIESPGGMQAVNLKVAEQYVGAFANIAKTNNTVIVPANLADLAGLITAAMTVFKAQPK